MNPEPNAKPASTKTGRFSSLAGLLRVKGSGAPSTRSVRPRGIVSASPRIMIVSALALLALFAMALTAAPALAGEVHGFSASFGEPGSGNGQLSLGEHSGIAVNQGSHDVYVADSGNGRVEQFTQAGAFIRTFGTFTTPTFIAIDNSPGGEGDLYVADSAADTVSKFEAGGTPVTAWGTAGQLSGFGGLRGIGVGPAGDLFVLNTGAAFRYGQSGSLIATFGTPAETAPGGLAVDTEDNLYKVDSNTRVRKVSDTGAGLAEGISPSPGAAGLAIDPSNNDLYVIQSGEGGFVNRFAVNCGGECAPIEGFGAGKLSNPQGIAVDQTSHHVYVASAGASEIDVAGLEYVAPPTATIEAASAVQFTTTHVAGKVNPEGEPSTCGFQYVTEAHFSAEGFAGAQSTPCATDPGSGTSPEPVEAELTGLAPHTSYHVRLAAHNRGGTTDSAEPNLTFETQEVTAPETTISAPSALTYHSAHLAGTVKLANSDPAFNTTSCEFQYATEADFSNATAVPCEPQTILASEAQPVAIKADLADLAAGTTYHLRLVAANLGGNSTALAANFATEAVAAPSATIAIPTAVTATAAHFSATLNSGGTGPGEQLATYAFSCEPACPGLAAPRPITADGADHEVTEDATGLEPNTLYIVTLTATSPGGEATASKAFSTEAIAPDATTLPFVGPAASDAARLYGQVNPHNSLTTYFFEYGPTAAYGTSIPVTENAPTAPGNNLQTVSQELTGLPPSTEYHYRIVAKSPAGTVKGADRTLTTAAAPSSTCPNDQLRSENNSTQLPDCRAWEQVTPAFKDGGAALHVEAISDDGSRVITTSLGGYAGVESDREIAYYRSERSGSGWATRATGPPASQFSARDSYAYSADLSRSLWALHTPSQSHNAEDLYLREPSGAFVEVGPMLPPSAVEGPPAGLDGTFGIRAQQMGASSDLSHVLFQIQSSQAPWPFDTTRNNSYSRALYEYVGTGNQQPALVGVDNAGDLLSECATVLGSIEKRSGNATYNADTYNAISATGETIFFTAESSGECASLHQTAEVNEVYARLGQFPIHTVAISEPTAADCAACDTEAANRANAEFQGASEDGSKVFFLTEQELLPGNPGRNLYEYDFNAPAGSRVAAVSHLASEAPAGVLGVARVSEDGSHVYFVAEGALTAANAEGNSPTAGAPNLYLVEHDAAHPAGRRAFIATLSPGDAGDFQSGFWSATDNRRVQATPDGRFLAFQSVADLTPGDTSSVPQVFEYDAEREELVRVSVGEAGYAAGAESADANPSTLDSQGYSSEAMPTAATTHLAISADGATIVFSSRGALTRSAESAAAAGALTVYRYHSAGSLQGGSVAAISNGSGTTTATLIGIDASGEDVFFENFGPLLAGDVDTQKDLYDARVGGGFPAPSIPPTCSGESGCRGQTSATPPKAAPATPGFHGPGNQTPKPSCPKGKVRKHGKCVKKNKAKRHQKSHRRANSNRGGQK